MASDLDFVQFVVDQMADAGSVSYRKMFGDYALICDNQLFVKPTAAGKAFIGEVTQAPPYPGARLAFLIEDEVEDRDWLSQLVRITAKELPQPKPKKKRRRKSGKT
jgi:TfoX/Sxy family transcriptional regulator of competence genes